MDCYTCNWEPDEGSLILPHTSPAMSICISKLHAIAATEPAVFVRNAFARSLVVSLLTRGNARLWCSRTIERIRWTLSHQFHNGEWSSRAEVVVMGLGRLPGRLPDFCSVSGIAEAAKGWREV